MNSALSRMIDRLDDFGRSQSSVISWGSPVPTFGDLSESAIGTLGLNPSNREFVDATGNELDGIKRRFHTLNSLGLRRWSDVNDDQIDLISLSCKNYFEGNPYNQWFKKLDYIVSAANASFYKDDLPISDDRKTACHLDLIPYATACKWTHLPTQEKQTLINLSIESLGQLIRDSSLQLLILNGRAVVDQFERVAGSELQRTEKAEWALPRKTGPDVMGVAYTGVVTELFGVPLDRELKILGYNHNIQSSFGVTRNVVEAIRLWIRRSFWFDNAA